MGNFNFTWDWAFSMLILLLKAVAILVIGHYLVKYVLRLINKSLKKTQLDASLVNFINKSVNIVLHIIIVLSALSAIGISTTGFLAALSAAAVGIGLALKDSLSSVAGGILLLITPKFATGDLVEIGGETGTVLQIDLLHTTIKTFDNRHVVIPNGNIVNSQIINYSNEENRRVDLTFSISYDNDVELAKRIILDVIYNNQMSLYDPDLPFVRVKEYAASSVDIIVRVWCKSENYWQLHFDLLESVRAEFDKNGISIPYNQLDVHINNK